MRKAASTNYAVLTGIAVLFAALYFAIQSVLEPQVEGFGPGMDSRLWFSVYRTGYLTAVAVCWAISALWLYMSENSHRLDWTGAHSQRSWWILYAIPPVLAALWSWFRTPAVHVGDGLGFVFTLVAVVLQFWIGTLICSPNPLSVFGGGWLRRHTSI